jgi:glycosyltransferase involved in cell wall biosynthesis
MPLRIALDVRHIRDFGIGTYIRSLVHALAGFDLETEYVLVGGAAEVGAFSGLPGNFRTAVYNRSDAAFLDNLRFPMFVQGLHADLVHIPLNRVPVLMRRPYVVTIHDISSITVDAPHGVGAELHRWRFQRGLLRAECVIAVSEATRRDVQNLFGVPAGRLRMVYNAPDPEFFNRGPDGAGGILERYQIDYPFLLYAGNIRPQKNIPRLVEAFAVVREQLAAHPVYKDLRLIIIGDEISRYPSVRQAVIKSRVEAVVRFLGFVPFDTLRCFYEAAAAFVFPSRYEGFGLPPLEAMACGTPVVTSSVSSLPEVVGDAAVLVNPENVFDIARGIREILLDQDLRAELVARGRRQAARFSWERTARAVRDIYREAARR